MSVSELRSDESRDRVNSLPLTLGFIPPSLLVARVQVTEWQRTRINLFLLVDKCFALSLCEDPPDETEAQDRAEELSEYVGAVQAAKDIDSLWTLTSSGVSFATLETLI